VFYAYFQARVGLGELSDEAEMPEDEELAKSLPEHQGKILLEFKLTPH
jgi:hypothetical protein